MGTLDRLMILVRSLHRPAQKPKDVAELDQRLDAVERRLEESRRRRLGVEAEPVRRAR